MCVYNVCNKNPENLFLGFLFFISKKISKFDINKNKIWQRKKKNLERKKVSYKKP